MFWDTSCIDSLTLMSVGTNNFRFSIPISNPGPTSYSPIQSDKLDELAESQSNVLNVTVARNNTNNTSNLEEILRLAHLKSEFFRRARNEFDWIPRTLAARVAEIPGSGPRSCNLSQIAEGRWYHNAGRERIYPAFKQGSVCNFLIDKHWERTANQYEWWPNECEILTDHPKVSLSSDAICSAVMKYPDYNKYSIDVMFVGDSLQNELAQHFNNLLSQICGEWMRKNRIGYRKKYVNHVLAATRYYNVTDYRGYRLGYHPSLDFQWADAASQSRYIVLNMGAHYGTVLSTALSMNKNDTEGKLFMHAMLKETKLFLQQKAPHPKHTVIWRDTPPAHENQCSEKIWSQTVLAPEQWTNDMIAPVHNWKFIYEKVNEITRQYFDDKSNGFYFMNVSYQGALRPDFHMKNDLVHHCYPSVKMQWAYMILNIILGWIH